MQIMAISEVSMKPEVENMTLLKVSTTPEVGTTKPYKDVSMKEVDP